MNLRDLGCFLAVAETGAAGRAAAALGLAQSTVSSRLARLEETLGTALFRRTAIGFVPTPAGRRLERLAEPLLEEADFALDYVFRGAFLAPTTVTVGLIDALPGVDLRRAVARAARLLRAREPHVRVRFARVGTGEAAAADIRLALVPAAAPEREGAVRVADRWLAVGLAESQLPAGGETATALLEGARAGVPALPDAVLAALAGAVPGLRLVRLDAEDVQPHHALGLRKDLVVLLPRGLASAGFVQPRLRLARLAASPADPAYEAWCAATAPPHVHRLLDLLAQELRRLVAAPVAAPAGGAPGRPRLDLRHLRCFAAAYEEGSVSRAATLLNVVQPALSMQLRDIEGRLASRLFERVPQGLEPTPAGRALYPLAAAILQDAADIGRRMRENSGPGQRILRIGLVPALDEDSALAEALAQAIADWRQGFPAVELRVAEGYSDTLRRWLRNELIEFAVLDNAVAETGLAVHAVSREAMALVTAPGAMAWPAGTVALARSAETALVLPSQRHGLRGLAERCFARAGLACRPAMEMDSLATTLRLVKAGGWATILPVGAIRRDLAAGTVDAFPIVEPTFTRELAIARKSRVPVSDPGRRFIRLFERRLRAVLAGLPAAGPA